MSIRIYSTDTDAGQISVIEKSSNGKYKNIAAIPIGNAPRGSVKFTKDGKGYVSNCGGNTISELDTFTNRETTTITPLAWNLKALLLHNGRTTPTNLTVWKWRNSLG
jgi:DNA-binding beta-propeller fold protein YncE